jgi:hypothetical protein
VLPGALAAPPGLMTMPTSSNGDGSVRTAPAPAAEQQKQ